MYTETGVETCAKCCMFNQATAVMLALQYELIEINLAVTLIMIMIINTSWPVMNKSIAAGVKIRI